MKCLLPTILFLHLTIMVTAQSLFRATVQDAVRKEPLPGATVRYFRNGNGYGTITNKDGQFALPAEGLDSIKISMIGYHSVLLLPPIAAAPQQIFLSIETQELKSVVVQSFPAEAIVRKAIEALPSHLPKKDFENRVFYREVIKEREQYFSVSEALFNAQYEPGKRDFRLALEQGRAKEDVAYTRLFEDYHPGGGPQFMAGQSFSVEVPACLQAEKMKQFTYRKDSLTSLDGRVLYVISFDQKDGVKEAYEKGTVWIDADNFCVLKYNAANSPKGLPYTKSLTGSDKIMAKVLGIDVRVLSWSRNLDFVVQDSLLYLQYSSYQRHLLYKQPRKAIDLDLFFLFEWMASEPGLPLLRKINENDTWKRSNLMVNLPTAFDSSFWGDRAIISPTDSLTAILRSLSAKNADAPPPQRISGWQQLNAKFFVAYQQSGNIVFTPVMKSAWNDDDTGPFLYKDTAGNFRLVCRLQATKASDTSQQPDRGFQQGGLLIRDPRAPKENSVFLALGTGGNPKAKVFFRQTENSRSKTLVNGVKDFAGQLLLEKSGDEVKAYLKRDGDDNWQMIGEHKASWLAQSVQAGLAGYADFAGNGPKMRPDIRFVFGEVHF